MLKIRMSRAGRKNLPFYKIVLTEQARAVKHGYKEVLGFYNPITKELKINKEKADKYISNGASYSDSLKKIVERNK